jgi:hypothetical protein
MEPYPLLAAFLVGLLTTGCMSDSKDPTKPAPAGEMLFDAAVTADNYLRSQGFELETKHRVDFVDFEIWSARFLSEQSSPELRRIAQGLPKEKISVFAYGPRIKQLGGTAIVFVGLQSKKVLALYRGK